MGEEEACSAETLEVAVAQVAMGWTAESKEGAAFGEVKGAMKEAV